MLSFNIIVMSILSRIFICIAINKCSSTLIGQLSMTPMEQERYNIDSTPRNMREIFRNYLAFCVSTIIYLFVHTSRMRSYDL